MSGDVKTTEDELVEHAANLLENCRQCGCAECVSIYHELIRSLMAAVRDLQERARRTQAKHAKYRSKESTREYQRQYHRAWRARKRTEESANAK